MRYMFLFEIFNQTLTHFGIVIFSVIKSYVFLAFLLITLNGVFVFFYKWHKRRKISFIVKESILLVLFIFLIIIPFDRGRRVEGLKEAGLNLVAKITQFKSETGKLPTRIEMLYPKYLNQDEFDLIKNKVSYAYFSHEEVNKQNSHDRGFIPLKEDYFNLSINEDFLGMERLQYYNKLNKFVLTDD